jgi:hypothetical protein
MFDTRQKCQKEQRRWQKKNLKACDCLAIGAKGRILAILWYPMKVEVKYSLGGRCQMIIEICNRTLKTDSSVNQCLQTNSYQDKMKCWQ